MKIITLCGSLRFKKEMMVIAEKLYIIGIANRHNKLEDINYK